jgi:hypothetical protein
MMYPIRVIKLVSGETLISGIAETGGVYTFERPMTVSMVQSVDKESKQPESMVFMKNWIDFSKDEMYIVPKSMVVCISNADPMILKDYNDAKIRFDMIEAGEDIPMGDDYYDDDEGEEFDAGDENDSDDDRSP